MEPGRVLAERYEILGPIAEGASSTVWEARDRATGETVAVKAVSLERAGWRAEVRDRFQQEARLLTLVRHEHVVGVHDLGETEDGYLYLVLDRLSGETLADRLARPPRLSFREAAAIALEIARGLGALHARGIVHRDLKPANVILHTAHDGRPAPPVSKIIDLGISKVGAAAADPELFATLTATGQVLGTPEYMSREQALGERDIDARTDVWALGVVLYEMLAARRPFAGDNLNAVLAAIRRGPPPRLSSVARSTPEALAQVVDRCLESARDRRYPDGEALADAIALAVHRAEEQAARAARRRRLVLAGGAALLAAGVGILALRGVACSPAQGMAPPPGGPALGSRELSVRVPAALRIERALDTLSVSADPAALATTQVTAGSGMVVGVETETFVFPRGGARPNSGRHGLVPGEGLDLGTTTWSTKTDGIPVPGTRYVVEMNVALFETDVPPGHPWNPHAGKYATLWTRTLRQAEE